MLVYQRVHGNFERYLPNFAPAKIYIYIVLVLEVGMGWNSCNCRNFHLVFSAIQLGP